MNAHPIANANQQKGGCCCSGRSSISTAETDARSVRESSHPLHQLQVQGATCGGCVKSIEQTLKSVFGVSEASMDLATGVASVVGAVDADHLVEVLQVVGFPAAVIR
ncbi:heavy-metal-associated domain-containing protein [Simiduia agarivorans]|uniref:Copper-translocating P-type ATPase n=1 Tax=Simiduia agarivorans (strain DSM 21679 / JCM 13881 / BCRC 17597 / SA1) TaxID=1117647 RepID=R9S4W9_SIMAS|nr:heavy-metal-associated domain-containing protein [Simiduia agarivorans]AGN11280.1 Copper-translocating P-type ATPase [Simiduia agarivorans SA1 = DSM 21679]